jgi:hypothetical protein
MVRLGLETVVQSRENDLKSNGIIFQVERRKKRGFEV